ncbi:dehydrogenase [Dictyobacter sp. S3.2.2.5]|uniref:Dehydrogenase n=1 Tax=Dictyobacter halimunensis TaxID=3026934 RepID=A0ABQ6FQ30_9CHLR|nr:dehydrogenase [Dictyobacter sp. S3.2.2.5]
MQNTSSQTLPRIAVLLTPERRRQMLSAHAEDQLASIATVTSHQQETLGPSDLPTLLDGAVACITGWGTPPLDEPLLRAHPQLRLVAHTAGSIRHLVSQSAMEQGLRVSHAAAIIADAVAELVIAQALLCLRQLHQIHQGMQDGRTWMELRDAYPGRLLGNRTVGVVGTGRVGRAVVHLLLAFGCRVLAYDPLLTKEQATGMNVTALPLDELMRQAEIVTLHAPVLPETIGMIGKTQLALLRNGAILLNDARAPLVDEEALWHELSNGRIVAALDVFSTEPLPPDSPLRTLPNVILSPHTAGHTIDTHERQGQAMVDEVRHFLLGETLRYEITPALFATLA